MLSWIETETNIEMGRIKSGKISLPLKNNTEAAWKDLIYLICHQNSWKQSPKSLCFAFGDTWLGKSAQL